MTEIYREADFRRKDAALIQVSDVFGNLPLRAQPNTVVDFDALLTAQVGNKGRFKDAEYPIGAWPELCDYAGVLLVQLRNKQLKVGHEKGLFPDKITEMDERDMQQLHPFLQRLAKSLGGSLIGILNHAPRDQEQASAGQNGNEFHVGITNYGDEIYAPLPYLRGLHSRGQLSHLYRIPNENGLWTPGEQFRSSTVAQLRLDPDILQPASFDDIPEVELDGRVAYTDVFGNIRLEVADIATIKPLFAHETQARLRIHAHSILELPVRVVRSLDDLNEGELGIYYNPADPHITDGPAYVELARKVSKPNGHPEHAYATMVARVTNTPENFDPANWDKINIEIAA